MKPWQGYLLAVGIIVIDQLTKYMALNHLQPYQSVEVLPVLNWTLAFNKGAAFSFLNGAGNWAGWAFAGFNMLVSLVLIVWMYRLKKGQTLMLLGMAAILGGALGNLIDRFMHGHVIDFIEMHVQRYYWPVFNIADSAICIGAVLLIIVSLRDGRNVD